MLYNTIYYDFLRIFVCTSDIKTLMFHAPSFWFRTYKKVLAGESLAKVFKDI